MKETLVNNRPNDVLNLSSAMIHMTLSFLQSAKLVHGRKVYFCSLKRKIRHGRVFKLNIFREKVTFRESAVIRQQPKQRTPQKLSGFCILPPLTLR